MKILPILLSDSYKQWHFRMYPEGLLKLYSNMTPRASRIGVKKALWFGLNYYLKEYLVKQWNELFFNVPLDQVLAEYTRFHKYFSGAEMDIQHIADLHRLGHLPLRIKALPEGSQVNLRVPFYTITNTVPGFGWLVNFLETPMSTVIWDMTTVATISYQYRLLLSRYALETTGSLDGVQWQAHDFSMRGRSSVETTQNQSGHLLSFTGTDTIPAVLMLEEYYSANMERELIGGSVPATEHSVMTSYGKESEIEAFSRILKLFPKGIVSVVADSYDLFSAIEKSGTELYDEIMQRDGKLVYRPDSGDPVDIICGELHKGSFVDYNNDKYVTTYNKLLEQAAEDILQQVRDDTPHGEQGAWEESLRFKFQDKFYDITLNNISWNRYDKQYYFIEMWEKPKLTVVEYTPLAKDKGVIELLWEKFGGTVNEQGYKVLDPHVGAIYGDSITLERAKQICERLKAKGFASTNIVFGIGLTTWPHYIEMCN